jgi:O-antigen/teichoic acid export membrane protein
MSYLKKAVFGTAIIFGFSILAAFFAYLFRLVLARNLSLAEYGLFYAVFSLIALFEIFKDLGLGEASVKYISEFKVRKRLDLIKNSLISSVFLQLIVSGVITILLIVFSDFLAINYFHDPQASIIIKIIAISFWLKPITHLFIYLFQGYHKMNYFASVDLTRSILLLILSFIGFKIIKTVAIPSLAYLLTPVLVFLIFFPTVYFKLFPTLFRKKIKFDPTLIKKLVSFGIPVIITSGGWLFLIYTDTIMLTFFSGLEQVGLYNAAIPTASLLHYFSIAFATVLLPLSSELWARNNKKSLRTGIALLYKYSLMVIIPFALVMFSFSDLILKIFFGANYVPAGNALKVLSIGAIFFIIAKVNFSVLSGIGKPKISTKITLIASILNILFNLILIPLFGIVGAAIATSTSFLIMSILSTSNLKKIASTKIPIIIWSKIILVGLLFVFVIYYLKKLFVTNLILESVLVAITGGVIYIALLFIFKLISLKEIRDLIKGITKKEQPVLEEAF